MTTPTHDTTICLNGNLGDGCGGHFPLKMLPGLCGKCTLLAKTENDEQYAKLLDWNQCPCCGRAWKNFRPQNNGGLCGGCEQNVAMPPPPVPNKPATKPSGTSSQPPSQDGQDIANTAVEGSKNARAHAMDCRISKQPNQDAPNKSADSSSSTTDGQIFLMFEARIRKSIKATKTPPIEGDIGKWGKAYAKTAFMSDILESEVVSGNIAQYWDKREGMSLLPEEAELRWQGNLNLPPGSDSMALGEFARVCIHGSYAAMFAASVSKEGKKNAAGGRVLTRIPLEIYINKVLFDERKQRVHGMRTAAATSRKRSGTESNARGLEKRHAGESMAGDRQLTFVRSQVPRHGTSEKLASVVFVRAAMAVSQGTGEVLITWPGDAEVENGALTNERFAEGSTKYVHSLVIGSELYVAKRFFDTGFEDAVPNADENKTMLELELMRLENLRWFMTGFFRTLKQRGVEYDGNISVVNAFLIRETSEPSEASGFGVEEFGEAVWLVEPRRPQAVRKFCGTLVHPSAKDKTAITVSALLHYIYDRSGEEMVYADVQGSKATVRGVETLVLFDPMTHTTDSDSGVGDHGEDGIEQFVNQHQCTYVCKGLGLPPLSEEGAYVPDNDDGEW